MALTDDDKEWMRLAYREEARNLIDSHKAQDHAPLGDDIRKLHESVGALRGDFKFLKGISYALNIFVAGGVAFIEWARGGK